MEINTLQQMANDILLRIGVTNIQVAVVTTGYDTIASTAGLYINFRPALDNVTAIGVIHIQPNYLGYFSNLEWRFILAHECSHIFHNHVVDTFFWQLLEKILKGSDNRNSNSRSRESVTYDINDTILYYDILKTILI
jgi:hypothetical protein